MIFSKLRRDRRYLYSNEYKLKKQDLLAYMIAWGIVTEALRQGKGWRDTHQPTWTLAKHLATLDRAGYSDTAKRMYRWLLYGNKHHLCVVWPRLIIQKEEQENEGKHED